MEFYQDNDIVLREAVNTIIRNISEIYPSTYEIVVFFYHDVNGNGPFIDKIKIKKNDGIFTIFDLIFDIEEELHFIRESGYGYSFTIDFNDKSVY